VVPSRAQPSLAVLGCALQVPRPADRNGRLLIQGWDVRADLLLFQVSSPLRIDMGDSGFTTTLIPPELWGDILRAATSVPYPMQIPSSLDLIELDACNRPAIQAIRTHYSDALVSSVIGISKSTR